MRLDVCLRRWQLEKLEGVSLETMSGQALQAEGRAQEAKDVQEEITAGPQSCLGREGSPEPGRLLVIIWAHGSMVAPDQKQPDIAC